MHTAESAPFFQQISFLSSHFAPAFLFLSPDRRRGLQTLYAVFRVLDDVVDKGEQNPGPILDIWRNFFEKLDPQILKPIGHEKLGSAFVSVTKAFDIPMFAFNDFLVHGLLLDTQKNQFETPMDTERYCYGVAGTVGVTCLPVFGVPWQEAKDFAVRLGITVQWINTIRDVGVDAQMGRIYLPQDHLEKFGCLKEDILNRRETPAFQELIRYEAGVARSHHRRSLELLPKKWEKELLPARIMGNIYMKLLAKIEKHNYPVLTRKVSLGMIERVTATLNALWS
ncbi:MAG: hypothetical protein KCHDKBKB_01212 [Elusimicrobia bacterium]|nr:hypothetical protein [Elusimicrobiota bacterium]